MQGTNYQVQYSPRLAPPDWHVLTNFVLTTFPHTIADPTAPAAGLRLYRAMYVHTNAPASYAPAVLAPAAIFHFRWQSGPTILTDTLVLNSPTNGMLLRQGSLPDSGMFAAVVAYTRLGPFLAQIAVIRPPGDAFPTGQTNTYQLAFTGPGGGWVQITEGPGISYVGPFTTDQSLVGQQVAASQLAAGEIFSLLTTNIGITNLTTLVINSPTSGALVTSGIGRSINPVSIEYSCLGPLSCQLQVVIPGVPTSQTNLYYLVYTSASWGWCKATTSVPGIFSLGEFGRDITLVGRQVASSQRNRG